MGLKKFDKIKELLREIAPEAFRHVCDGNAQFLANKKGTLRDGFVTLIDGSSVIEKALWVPCASPKTPSASSFHTSGRAVGEALRKEMERCVQAEGCHACVCVMDLPDYKTRAKVRIFTTCV
jgi:hypothetical protein